MFSLVLIRNNLRIKRMLVEDSHLVAALYRKVSGVYTISESIEQLVLFRISPSLGYESVKEEEN